MRSVLNLTTLERTPGAQSFARRASFAAIVFVLSGFALFQSRAWADETCPRSEPEAYFEKVRFPIKQREFKRLSAHEAIETLEFIPGQKIQIRHWGCEYLVDTISITAADIPALSSDSDRSAKTKQTLALLVTWLRELDRLQANSLFDLKLAANTIEKKSKGKSLPTLNQEFPVAGDGEDFLQTKVTIERLDRHDGTIDIRVSLSKGPL